MIGVQKIEINKLLELMASNHTFQFIDLSDDELGRSLPFPSTQIHFSEIEKNINSIEKESPVIVACMLGEKSFFASHMIQTLTGRNDIFSLEGGILALQKVLKEKKN